MSITTKQVMVTPQMAEDMLLKHYDRVAKGEFKQRQVYRSVLNKYTADMKSGHWTPTPVPIIYDENDDLADGQHRLEACRKSGKTIEFTISSGWPVAVIDSIDRGKARTVGNQLHLHGYMNANVIAASVNCLVRVCYRGEAPPITYAACKYIMEDLDMGRHIQKMKDISSNIKMGGRTLGPLAFYRTVSAKKADEFIERLVSLDLEKNTGPSTYARYLRERSVNDQGDAVRSLCACIKAWDEDESIAHLKGGGHYGVDYLADKNKKLVSSIRELLGDSADQK